MKKLSATTAVLALLISVSACSTPAGSSSSPASTASTAAPVKMLNVVGASPDNAVRDLTQIDFTYEMRGSDGEPITSSEWPSAAAVAKQSVEPGTDVAPGTKVELTLNMTAGAAKAQKAKEQAAITAAATKAEAKTKAAEKAAAAKADAEAKAAAAKEAAAEKAAAEAEKKSHERNVTYVIEADGPIGVITYTNFVNNKMGQEQSSGDVMGPVRKVYKFQDTDFESRYGFWSLGVSAQAGEATSTITCRILMDGRELTKQTSTGPYSVVTCNTGA